LPQGFEIAKEQFPFAGNYFTKEPANSGSFSVTTEGDRLIFKSGNISGEFNKKEGRFTRYGTNDGARTNGMPEPYFWRAPTDNDFGNNMPERLGLWRNAHAGRQLQSVNVGEKTDSGVAIKVVYQLALGVPYTVDYLLQNDGSIKLTAAIDMTGHDLPEMPRFGMRMQLPNRMDSLTYYGRGPWENYSDRNTSSFMGWYTNKVENEYSNSYIRPQESGNHTQVRWLTLTDNSGNGWMIEGIQPIAFSATGHSTEDLDPGLTKKQQHPTNLRLRNTVYLNIDLAQRGVGGDDSWGALPHNQYRLLDKKYSYSYVLKPVGK